MKEGVSELDLLSAGEKKSAVSLNSGEVERVDVGGVIEAGGRELYVVDEIGISAAKECGARGDARCRTPIGPSLKAPGGFRLQVWIADCGGIGVVEVGVGGQTESTTAAGA